MQAALKTWYCIAKCPQNMVFTGVLGCPAP
nr:MAG TPA: hypothetical protein [Caudoviricetes sp.]